MTDWERREFGTRSWSEYAWDTVNTKVKIFTHTYSLFPCWYILPFIYILFCWNSSVSKMMVFELVDMVLVRYRPAHPPVQLLAWTVSGEVKQTEHKADQSLQITAEFNGWRSTSTSPYAFMVSSLPVSGNVLNDVMSDANEVGRILEVCEWDCLWMCLERTPETWKLCSLRWCVGFFQGRLMGDNRGS